MNIYEIIIILFIHWIADFVFQTDKQAKGKSKNWNDLLSHTYIYSLIWYVCGICYIIYLGDSYNEWTVTKFTIITFFCHTIQDYITSRENSKLWEQSKTHNFFVFIGFDQWLH